MVVALYRQCQTEAMSSYHVVESKFMDVLFQHGLKKKEWFLALRTVTLKPLSYFKENYGQVENARPKFGLEQEDAVYTSEAMSSLFNLVRHQEKWQWREHFYKAFFALFFIRCLQKADYFGSSGSKDVELSTRNILFIHINTTSCFR